VSVGLLIATCIINMEAPPSLFPKIDYWFHIVAAGLLLFGAILYIISAVMINAIYWKLEDEDDPAYQIAKAFLLTYKFLFIAKLVAAILAILEAAIYLLLGLKLKKIMKENNQRQMIAQQAQSVGLHVSPTGSVRSKH